MKRTIGLWKRDSYLPTRIVNQHNDTVCDIPVTPNEHIDNANIDLITAAPEMLEALEKANKWIAANQERIGLGTNLPYITQAIKNAKGLS